MNIKECRVLHILGFLTFLFSGLTSNLIQLVLFLVLPRRAFHRANSYLVTSIYGHLVCLADWWGGSRLTMHCSEEFHRRVAGRAFTGRSLIVLNHHTELDWLYCWQFADRCGLLGGCRALAKKVLQYLPIIGWSSWFSGDVYLSRSWEKDQITVKEKIAALEEQPEPSMLFVFPEGTRLTPGKLEASREFAASRGLPLLSHHLVPRTKGFSLVASHMKGTLVDLTFVQGADTAPPTLHSLLTGRRVETRVYVREFPLSSIPTDPTASSAWLINLWREKDELKEAAMAGDMARLEELGEFEAREMPPRVWTLVWALVANMVVLVPLLVTLLQGSWATWGVATLAMALAWLAMDRMVNVSKIKKEQ